MTTSGGITQGLADLKDRALQAFYKLGNSFRQDVSTTLFLYSTLVRSILLYASDFWGCLKMPRNNPIEVAHMRFCKDMLGVQRQATNIGVLLELGEIPLVILAKNSSIKNYSRISISNKANNLLLNLAQYPFCPNSWFSTTKNTLDMAGIRATSSQIHKTLLPRMRDMFHQESFLKINADSSKLRTYGKLKTKPGLEQYLLSGINVKHLLSSDYQTTS